MKYIYSFYRDHLNILRIKLPDEVKFFADFIEDIATVKELDEYIEDIEKVLNGSCEDFEIQLNATSVLIKKMRQLLSIFLQMTNLMKIKWRQSNLKNLC